MNKITRFLVLITFLGLLPILTNCQKKNMDKFKWDATSCAPKMYGIGFYEANFIFENGATLGIPGSFFLQNGWGNDGPTAGSNSLKPVPIALEVTYLSYSESKFYTGKFQLPKETMIALFKKGFTEFYRKKHVTYETLIVGIAPGGVVVVWMFGVGKEVEIGRFQATETKVSMKDFAPTSMIEDPNEYVKDVMECQHGILDSIKKNGIPYGIWDIYRERFNWRPVIDYEDKENGVTDEIVMNFLNGENDVLSLDLLKTNPFEMRARIKDFNIGWSSKRILKEADIVLNEEELFKAFRFIFQDNPKQEGQFRIHINKDNSFIRIYLENNDLKNHREIELYNANIKIYPVDEDQRSYYTKFKNEFPEN